MTDHLRGPPILCIDGKWFYKDTGQPTVKRTTCGHCGKPNTAEDHDGCLGTLPGLMNACCGHGQTRGAYVQFLDGVVIGGESAIIILNELKKVDDND